MNQIQQSSLRRVLNDQDECHALCKKYKFPPDANDSYVTDNGR